MSIVGSHHNREHNQRRRKGAVPLGQHSHSPAQVMPLPSPATTPATVHRTLPRSAPSARGCAICLAPAALIEPTTQRAYCTDHWISWVVQRQLD
jgi:hypothetical protein